MEINFMKITHILGTSVSGLMAHKSRSILTILGIVIGITAIILIMSLGEGAQNLILGQIQGQVGSRVIEVAPGRQAKGPSDFLSLFSDSLKQKDVDALSKKSNLPHADKIMPLVFGSETAAYASETYQTTLYGVTDAARTMYNMRPEYGRFLLEDDVKSYADVVVIGAKVKEELFGGNEAIGQKIKIKGKNFKVIGILEQKGQGFINFDQAVIIPYTTAQQDILGIKYFNHIIVEADSEENIPRTVEDIKMTLRNSHNITDPEKDDFNVNSQADAMKTVGTITSVLTLFLVAVAAVSLLVGGIGIMNIMLVSVTERTREIGLRKALGAHDKDILLQFVVEALVLCLFGGLIGIGISYSVATIFNSLGFTFKLVVTSTALLLALGVSSGCGLVFGLYPAVRATRLDPIEALRYE